MPEGQIETINGTDSFSTKIQINQFNSDHFTAQNDHFDNTQDVGQTQCDDVDNSKGESYNGLDNSQ